MLKRSCIEFFYEVKEIEIKPKHNMKILIVGANGQIGSRLARKLKNSDHDPIAMVRKEEQIEKFKQQDIKTVLADLENDISHAFDKVDAVVFTAGSGANTPKSQTKVIDEEGAKKSIDQAVNAKVDKFVMVSALMADRDPNEWPESMQHYYEAKSNADNYLREAGLNYTILMPGRLTNEEGTGSVELKERIEDPENRSISRDDVAAVIVRLLESEDANGMSLDLLSGPISIERAVADIS